MKTDKDDGQLNFYGIKTIQTEEDQSQYSTFLGGKANFLSQSELYALPAVIEALNLLELSLKKNIPDQFDINIFRAITRLIKVDEIYHLRPTITPASLDSLAKKSAEIEKISLPENSNEAKDKNKQQEEDIAKLQKAVEEHKANQASGKTLSPKEIEYQSAFLVERTAGETKSTGINQENLLIEAEKSKVGR
jgi:hypothetical protein